MMQPLWENILPHVEGFLCLFGVIFPNHDLNIPLFSHERFGSHTHTGTTTRFLPGDFLRFRISKQKMKEVHLVAVDLSETHSFQRSKCWTKMSYTKIRKEELYLQYTTWLLIVTISMDLYQPETSGR